MSAQPAPDAASGRDLIVIGGGEHAGVVVDAARSRPGAWNVVGFSDRDPAAQLARREPELHHLGGDDAVADHLAGVALAARPALVLGIGGGTRPRDRSTIVERFPADTHWATVVHDAAWVSPAAALGEGVVVGAAAVVQAGARLGRHAIVNTGAIVEHDVTVGEFVHLAPGAVVGGGSRIGDGAFVGLGATIRDHLSIGADATIGMGAVVVDDVAPGATVVGVPARPAAASA